MEKQILFIDWHGTLSESKYWQNIFFNERSITSEIDKILFSENKDLIQQWMRGHHTAEEVNSYLSKELGIEESRLREQFLKGCMEFNFSNAIKSHLVSLRRSYHVVLITGNTDSFNRYIVNNLKLQNIFHEIHNSYDSGLFKTDKEGHIFKEILQKQNASSKNAILIDDCEKTCEIFSNLGGKSYNVKNSDNAARVLIELLHSQEV